MKKLLILMFTALCITSCANSEFAKQWKESTYSPGYYSNPPRGHYYPNQYHGHYYNGHYHKY